MDISKITVWDTIAWRRRKGEHPTAKELADAIRAAAITPEMREYVAGRMDGSMSPPRGRPTGERQNLERWARVLHLTVRVRLLQVEKRSNGEKSPRERALEQVAAEDGIAVETLRKLLRRGLKGAPISVRSQLPSVADIQRFRSDEKEGV